MKLLSLALFISLTACGAQSKSSPKIPAPEIEAVVTPDTALAPETLVLTSAPEALDNTPVVVSTPEADTIIALCPSDASIACYPAGSPARRNDLYECSNSGTGHAFVEFMNDGSRLYHVTLKLPLDITETFVAEEVKIAAAAFNPLPYGEGAPQSSRVLHGMAADTRLALGFPEDRNFLLTLIGRGPGAPVTMTVATDAGEDLGISDMTCARVGN